MEDEKFKILSIDGGGIRGIVPAKILCEFLLAKIFLQLLVPNFEENFLLK